MAKNISSRILTALAVLTTATVVSLPALPAAAAPAGLVVSATSVSNGGTFDLTTTVPVQEPGTSVGTITNRIDPNRVHIMNPATDVQIPTGWTLSFSTDGQSWQDYNPNGYWDPYGGWAFIRATGNVVAPSVSNGRVAATATATSLAPSMSSITGGGGGGDGWDVAIDTSTGDIYNLWHHNGAWWSGFSTGSLDCHDRITGGQCAGNWPFRITNLADPLALNTSQTPYEWVDSVRHHVWFPTHNAYNSGFGCIDVSNQANPQWCGGTEVTGFVVTSPGSQDPIGLAQVDSKIFALFSGSRSLQCVDVSANAGNGAPCSQQPVAINAGDTFQPWYGPVSSLTAVNGLVMGMAQGSWFCVDASTLGTCSGWSGFAQSSANASINSGYNATLVWPMPKADGSIAGICASAGRASLNSDLCMGTNGTPLTVNAGLSAAMHNHLSPYSIAGSKVFPTLKSKIFFNTYFPGGGFWCYDVATGGYCPGWGDSPRGTWSLYTVTLDPSNDYCLWTNSDQDGIGVYNTATGEVGCPSQGPATVTFDSNVIIPKLSCSGKTVRAWQTFKLVKPTLGTGGDARSATITITDSDGQRIAGWTNKRIPVNGVLNLANLDVGVTGQTPTVTVNFVDRNPAVVETTATLTAVNDMPQLCVHATADACPMDSEAGLIPRTADPRSPVGFSSELQGPTSQQNQAGSKAIALGAPDRCGSSVQGRATYYADGSPVRNARVQLYYYPNWGNEMQPVLDASGMPVEARTASDGSYSFADLGMGKYSVAFSSVDHRTTVYSSSDSWGGNDSAQTDVLVASPLYFEENADVSVNATYAGATSLPPEPPTKLGGFSSSGSVTVAWDVPTSDGGSPITGYHVVAPDGQTCTVDASTFTCTFNGLTDGQLGSFDFYAINANGNSMPATLVTEAGGFGGQAPHYLQTLNGKLLSSDDLSNWTQIGSVPANTNALAYDAADGFAYAMDNGSNRRQLLRILGDGSVQVAGRIVNPKGPMYAGAVDPTTGKYYVANLSGKLYSVNSDGPGTYRLDLVGKVRALAIGADFVVNSGVLYTVAQGVLVSFNVGNGGLSGPVDRQRLGLPSNSQTGAFWTDLTAGFDVRYNGDRVIYHTSGFGGGLATQVYQQSSPDTVPVDGTTITSPVRSPIAF